MNAAVTLSSAETQRQCAAHVMSQPTISIIVSVLNEAPLIRAFLQHLRVRASEAEIIVVDGGSSDRTAELAAGFCDQLLRTEPGRSAQMNAGARVACGNILWFLHVDVEVPPRCLDEIARVMADPRVAGGYFRIRLPRARFIYRLTDTFAHYAGLVLRMRCGDHGLFCRRRDFVELGGFPDVPLMEDVEFFRMLWRRGDMHSIEGRLVASVRRYEQIGPRRLTLAYGLIAMLYVLKVPLSVLASIYKRRCCRSI
jgi:rSAM/selenodomain-associated transferase 2